jgi:plasmid maintenance system antidote protein VapI
MLMNLNRGATEIVTSVQPGEQYAAGMADPEDDRGEALAWYVRLLVRQELDRGTERKELLERLGIQKGHLSQIERGKLGVGVPKLIQFAAAFGYTPGVLLDRALSWWQSAGRQERARVLLEAANHAAHAVSESGEHPSQSPLKAAK